MKLFDTSNFSAQRHTKMFTRKGFLTEASAVGADAVLVEACYFPERAMYWTRMFHREAWEAGMQMEAIIRSAELDQGSAELQQEIQSDLLEWVRIAALSRIPNLLIRIDSLQPQVNENLLTEVLQPVARSAASYGTRLVLAKGTAELDENALVRLAKCLGYEVCRINTGNLPENAKNAVWHAWGNES